MGRTRRTWCWLFVLAVGCGGDAPAPRHPPAAGAGTATASADRPTPGGARGVDNPTAAERLVIKLERRMGDGKLVTAFEHRTALSALGDQPITLVIEGEPRVEQTKTAGGGGLVGGLAGALGGLSGQSRQGGKTESKLVGMRLDAHLDVGGKTAQRATAESSCAKPSSCVVREVLVLTLEGGGSKRAVERLLFEQPNGSRRYPSGYRRYVLSVLGREVTQAQLEARLAAVEKRLDVAAARKRAAELGHARGDARQAAIEELRKTNPGSAVGEAINLRFAALSDRYSAKLAELAGVKLVRPLPRLLISSFETAAADHTVVSLDLRLDEVHTVDAGGRGVRHPRLQLARGLLDATLEGAVLRQLGVRGVTTTAALMKAAHEGKIEPRLVIERRSAVLAELKLPHSASALLDATLAAGHQVVIPARAVTVAGRMRYGWWDVDPASGRIVGVMDDGQHQAAGQYGSTLQEVPLNDRTAFVLGLHAGSTATMYGIASAALSHGKVDASIADEVKASIANIACTVCPSAGVGASLSIDVGDCYSKDILSVGKSVGSFCEAYQSGFACASGTMLSILGGKSPVKPGASGGAKITIGCASAGVGG